MYRIEEDLHTNKLSICKYPYLSVFFLLQSYHCFDLLYRSEKLDLGEARNEFT